MWLDFYFIFEIRITPESIQEKGGTIIFYYKILITECLFLVQWEIQTSGYDLWASTDQKPFSASVLISVQLQNINNSKQLFIYLKNYC